MTITIATIMTITITTIMTITIAIAIFTITTSLLRRAEP
jgi:hypothetical protein